jgi:hypothetical protein
VRLEGKHVISRELCQRLGVGPGDDVTLLPIDGGS